MAEIEGLNGTFPLTIDEAKAILGRKIIGVRSSDPDNLFLEIEGFGQIMIYGNDLGLTVSLQKFDKKDE